VPLDSCLPPLPGSCPPPLPDSSLPPHPSFSARGDIVFYLAANHALPAAASREGSERGMGNGMRGACGKERGREGKLQPGCEVVAEEVAGGTPPPLHFFCTTTNCRAAARHGG
jgi:hypothetical protein